MKPRNFDSDPSQPVPRGTVVLLDTLLATGASPTYGDEAKKREVTGRRKVVMDNPDGRVAINKYLEHRQHHMAAVLEGATNGELGLPLGHVEFSYGESDATQTGVASISGAVYVMERGNVASVHITHDVENPQSNAAYSCFRMARALGLGDIWTESFFTYAQDPEAYIPTEVVRMEPPQTYMLDQALESFIQQGP